MADLNNIDAEIKRIEQLKQKYESLLDVEKSVNSSMLYGTGVRKKYTDALSAAATAQKDLMAEGSKQANIIIKNNAGLKSSLTYYKSLKKKQDDLRIIQKKLRKGSAQDQIQWKKNQKVMKDIGDEMKSTKGSMSNMESQMASAIKKADSLKGSAKALEQTFDDLKNIDSQKISSSSDLNALTDQRLKIMKQQFDIQKNSGTLEDDEADSLKDKLDQLEEMNKVRSDLLKGNLSDELAPMVDDLTKSANELANPKAFKKNNVKELERANYAAQSRKGIDLKSTQLGNLKTLFSGKTSFGDKMNASKSFKGADKELGRLNEVMKVTGKSALGVGNMMKMLGSALGSLGKLGWIGLIIQAVTAVANVVNDLDKFLKNFNQTFAQLQGPTVMMKDVKKSMRDFSDSIFDLQRNLKYGLKSEEIMGMFKAVSESGMSLQGLLQNVQGGYGKMIEEAAKVSLNFGVSVEEAGAMLGEQMTDLRSSVDDASEGFKVLSYDASIAGIQSQKFYQATYAAAEALSYYGKFLTSASNTLKNFQQQGGMGFKDAQKQTQELTNLFTSMSDNQKTAFIEMSGGVENYRKDFIKLEDDSKKAITKHLSAIAAKRIGLEEAKTKGDKEAVERIQNEIKAEENQLTTAERVMAQAGIAARSNSQDMAAYLGLISDKVGEKMADYFKMTRKDNGPDVFSGNTRAIKEHMKAVLGVSDEFALKMIGTIQASRVGIERMAEDLQGLVDKLPEGKDSKEFRDEIGKIISIKTAEGKMDMDAIKSGLDKYGADNKINVSGIYDMLNRYPGAVEEFMKKGYNGVMSNIETISLDSQKNIEQVTGEGDKEQAKRLDDLVKGTHTIGDFLGINTDQLKYIAATSPPQELLANAAIATARSTGKILDFIVGRWGTNKEKTEKKLNDVMESKLGSEIKELKYTQIKLSEEYKNTTDKEKKESLLNQIKAIDKMVSDKGASAETVVSAFFDAQKMYEKDKSKADVGGVKVEDRAKPPVVPAVEAPVKPERDYKALTGGYSLLSKGDVVVNANSMSTGIGGDIGAFSGAASNLLKSIGTMDTGRSAAPTIPVQITIGSVSGEPEEFLKRIKPAIEQAFERMYFDKQKRK